MCWGVFHCGLSSKVLIDCVSGGRGGSIEFFDTCITSLSCKGFDFFRSKSISPLVNNIVMYVIIIIKWHIQNHYRCHNCYNFCNWMSICRAQLVLRANGPEQNCGILFYDLVWGRWRSENGIDMSMENGDKLLVVWNISDSTRYFRLDSTRYFRLDNYCKSRI